MMVDREWLAGLKHGDKVAYEHGHLGKSWSILTVTKRTATQIVCETAHGNVERFRAETGSAVKRDRLRFPKIEPLTDEIRAAIQRERDLSRLQYAKWGDLPNETLRAVCDLLDARHPPKRSA